MVNGLIPYKIKALYGTFNINLEPVNTIDVTDCVKRFALGDTITIPATINFNKEFGNITDVPGLKKYLQISIEERVYNIAEDDYANDISINFQDKGKRIIIVYYLYVNPHSNWRGIISGQLLQLKSYGLLPEADLYVHVTDLNNIAAKVAALIMELTPSAKLSFNYENLFEYPGIKLIHELATQYPDANFIYFHAKGMSYNIHSRSASEITLFNRTFENWRKNIQLLNQNGIQKIGLFPGVSAKKHGKPIGNRGWIWYNYWYATGKYLSNCPDPIITTDRYYYEDWLAMQGSSEPVVTNDCLSLYKIKFVSVNYFTAIEADYHSNLVQRHSFKLSQRAIQIFASPFLAHCYLQTII